MNTRRTLNVFIPTFINPTLFWVIDTNTIAYREEFEKELLEYSLESAVPAVGEIVAVKDGNHVKRAKIIEADEDGGRYFCWLIDYGVAIYVSSVYNLLSKHKEIPALALRASLMDVVYLHTTFDVVDSKVHFEETAVATDAACSKALLYINEATDTDLKIFKMKNDICFGDLIISKDNKYLSLTNELVKAKILAKNVTLFWQSVEELSPISNFSLILRSISKSSLISGNVSAKYDDEAQTYVVVCPAKDLIEEFQSEETESVGRSCRLRSVKVSEKSNSQRELRPVSKNETSAINQGIQSDETASSEKKSPKSLSTRNILNKLKSFKTKNGSSNNDDSTNSENAEDFNESKALQIEGRIGEQPTTVKIARENENKEQITHDDKTDCIADSISDTSSISHLNFIPDGCHIAKPKKAIRQSFQQCSNISRRLPRPTVSPSLPRSTVSPTQPQSTVSPTQPRSTVTCTSETGSDTFRTRKFSISSSKSSTSAPSEKHSNQSKTPDAKNVTVASSTTSSSSDEAVLTFSEADKKLIGCTCDMCKIWDVGHDSIKKFADSEVQSVKTVTKPPLLLKNGDDERIEIKTLSTLPSSIALKGKKVQLPPLVVHGVVIPSPTVAIQDAPFHESVHNCLSGFEQAKKIQMFVWPAIMRNMNVCYVNGPKSGKTMAYLPAIYSFLLDETRYSSFNGTLTGPLAVVVCPGSRKAEAVYEMVLKMKKMMRDRNNCDAVLGILPISPTVTKLLSRKHSLLVTTLPSLIILLQLRKVSLKRLCHLVFEDSDILLEKYPKQLKSLLGLCQQILEHRTCSQTIQIILSSEQWTNRLREITCQLKLPPLICIGAYLEAAVYGNASIKFHFLTSKLKQSTLIDILIDDKNSYNKCVVICNTEKELEEASFLFPNRSIKSIIIKGSLMQTEIRAREQQWDGSIQGAHPVLLCTDDVFNKNLNVTDATLLVHYSLPESWTHFAYRFSSFVDNYTCPFGPNSTNDVICKSFIIVDENSVLQFSRLVAFAQRMNATLPNSFIQHCKKIKNQEEVDKINRNVKICDSLKVLGSCSDEKCQKRHLLSNEVDFACNIDGYVKFEILDFHDVSTYTVRIIEFYKNGEIIKNSTDVQEIEDKLQEALKSNRENVDEINVGDWFATLTADGKRWKRCEVLKMLVNGSVRISYLDDGVRDTVRKSNLHKLPEEFEKIRPQATLVHFVNMVPPENDLHFSSYSTLVLQRIARNAEEKFGSTTYKGRIRLYLKGDILWLDNIVLIHRVKNTEVSLLYLRDKLLKNKLADYKENTLDGLFELCRGVDIPIPEYKVVESNTKKREIIEPSYAFFEEDVSYSEVYFKAGNSPTEFFVCLTKFNNLVQKLENDILKVVHKSSYELEDDVVAGEYYLALDVVDKKYCRVRVISIENNYANCFFVDYGDQQAIKLQNIRRLPQKFITRLPFQAIECRLFGIQPALDIWCQEATDILYDYCFEPDSDYYRTLYAVVCSKEAAKLTNGKKYNILLLDNLNGRTISIGNLMIDCGFATLVENEKMPEELPVIENYVLPYSDDDDEFGAPDEQTNDVEKYDEIEDEIPDDWDLQIFDAFDFLTGKNVDEEKVKQVLQKTPKLREIRSSPSPPPVALPLAEFRTPRVEWYQTDIHIKFDILLPDVTEHIAKVLRDRVFVFRTTQNGVPYHLSIQLYAKVEKTFVHSAGGQVVKVTLSKCRKEEWPRLTIQKNVKNIKYKLGVYQEPETEESGLARALVLNNKDMEEPEDNICYVGSDFDESSDSDMVLSD